jgi:hypothetical protein
LCDNLPDWSTIQKWSEVTKGCACGMFKVVVMFVVSSPNLVCTSLFASQNWHMLLISFATLVLETLKCQMLFILNLALVLDPLHSVNKFNQSEKSKGLREKERKRNNTVNSGNYVCHAACLQCHPGSARTPLGPKNQAKQFLSWQVQTFVAVYTLHFDNMLEGYQHNNFPY